TAPAERPARAAMRGIVAPSRPFSSSTSMVARSKRSIEARLRACLGASVFFAGMGTFISATEASLDNRLNVNVNSHLHYIAEAHHGHSKSARSNHCPPLAQSEVPPALARVNHFCHGRPIPPRCPALGGVAAHWLGRRHGNGADVRRHSSRCAD